MRLSDGSIDRQGPLLSVKFTAIGNGESQLTLDNFQAGSRNGETIPVIPPEIRITVGEPSISDVDVSDDIFSLSTDITPVRLGETFTLRLSAENVPDLAGWQADIAFDSAALEAVEVSEGDFLKQDDGDTFFLKGTIDNTAGKIADISTAKLKGSSSGTGTLLSVTFTAKAAGETRVIFSNFFAGASSGEAIPSDVPDRDRDHRARGRVPCLGCKSGWPSERFRSHCGGTTFGL